LTLLVSNIYYLF